MCLRVQRCLLAIRVEDASQIEVVSV
jgi:hypothetical protein